LSSLPITPAASCSSHLHPPPNPTLPNPFTPISVTYLDAEKTEAVLDWEDPKAARALTQTLLHHDFGLEWDIPLERLCPPVPNRLNYICWVEDLLRLGRVMMNTNNESHKRVVRGLDVGTGASAIYPLLGCKVHDWHFLGTDIDPVALEAAWSNVRRNKLEDCIKLKLVPRVDYSNVTSSAAAASLSLLGPIRMALGGEDEQATTLDFVMCNPPFFGSLKEIHAGSVNKDGSSSSSSEGLPAAPQTPHGCVDEVITPGGELTFVTAMVRDSLVLREKVGWYTSMVGKKSSLRKVLAVLREAGVRNVRTTEFLQGRTTRWGVGWSFTAAGLGELEGGVGSAHKVFGKKKAEKKREAVHSFVVKEDEGRGEEEGQGLDEGAVLQRVLDYFQSTRQVRVARVGVASGGAEDLYRKMVLAEVSGQGVPEAPPPTIASPFAVPPVPPSDPAWKSRCVVLVTMLAGAAAHAEEEEEKETGGGVAGMEVEKGGSSGGGEEGGEGGHWVKVTIEMTSGGDRAVFWKLCSLLPGEVARTNRKWRRKLKGGGGEGGSGGGGGGVGHGGGGGGGGGGEGVTSMVARLNV